MRYAIDNAGVVGNELPSIGIVQSRVVSTGVQSEFHPSQSARHAAEFGWPHQAQGKIGFPTTQRHELNLLCQRQGYPRIARPEITHPLSQYASNQHRTGAERHPAAQRRLFAPRRALDGESLLFHLRGELEHPRAHGGEPAGARQTLHQAYLQTLLQRRDAAADRRMIHLQGTRRPGQAACLRDRDEMP